MLSCAEQNTGIFQDLDQMAIEDAINGSSKHTKSDKLSLSAHIGRCAKAFTNLMTDMRHMLTTLGWTDQKAELLPKDSNLSPDLIQLEQIASQ